MRQSPVLSSFPNTPEAGPFPPPELPGFLGTSDPLRRPDGPPPFLAAFSGSRFPRPSRASPTDARLPFRRAVLTTPVDPMGARWLSLWRAPAPGFFPFGAAFPGLASGRRPHCRFRGLLKLHACYGPPDCSPTIRGLCREVSIGSVTRTHRSPAIESNHQLFVWVLPPLVISPFGAHARPPALPGPYFAGLLGTPFGGNSGLGKVTLISASVRLTHSAACCCLSRLKIWSRTSERSLKVTISALKT